MGYHEFLKICREKVSDFFNTNKDITDQIPDMNPDEVYVVWYCKSLQNHKALLFTPAPDGMYYEFTYNGDRNELYMDAYKKWKNIKFDMEN